MEEVNQQKEKKISSFGARKLKVSKKKTDLIAVQ